MNLENHLKRSFFFHCKHPKSFREARGPGKFFFSFSAGWAVVGPGGGSCVRACVRAVAGMKE